MKSLKRLFLIILVLIVLLILYLMRPVSGIPGPATFHCYQIEDGTFTHLDSLPAPNHIYGMGLTYSQHLKETASSFDKDIPPPIFKKSLNSICRHGSKVQLPTKAEMIKACNAIEPDLSAKMSDFSDDISPLLDYEVELGIILLEDIPAEALNQADFVPSLGFFLSNDVSSRSVALLGEGMENKYEYWGISKSFPGFTPVSDQIWVPNEKVANGMLCVRISTFVNEVQRQSQTTDNMIFTPSAMLKFIKEKYPNTPLRAGDMILTGTPGGVAVATPRALVRASNLLGMDRFRKLAIKLEGDQSAFLKEGDQVEVRAAGFDPLAITITK